MTEQEEVYKENRKLLDEIKMLKGCIDYINPTHESVDELIADYKEYLKSFEPY